MRALILYILIIIGGLTYSQEELFLEGNEAYKNEKYQAAIEAYNKVIAQDYYSSDLYYNLANAYYRNAELGKSIWAYEIALKIDPSNTDAKANLQFVNAQTVDKIDNHRPGLGTWLTGLLFGPKINLWAWISILSSLTLSISLLIFFKTKSRRKRNLGMILGTFAALLMLFSSATAYLHKESILQKTSGIIVSEKASVKVSPLETATNSFELNEGTKVNLVESKDDWTQIEVNGNRGWILKSSIWEI